MLSIAQEQVQLLLFRTGKRMSQIKIFLSVEQICRFRISKIQNNPSL